MTLEWLHKGLWSRRTFSLTQFFRLWNFLQLWIYWTDSQRKVQPKHPWVCWTKLSYNVFFFLLNGEGEGGGGWGEGGGGDIRALSHGVVFLLPFLFMWVLDNKLGSSGLGGNCFTCGGSWVLTNLYLAVKLVKKERNVPLALTWSDEVSMEIWFQT